jgi:ABC-2 type transport system ATP-binding protein
MPPIHRLDRVHDTVPMGYEITDGEIVVSGLTKHYKQVKAVDGLSFAVKPGRVTGFLGPNGAGKTTTLRMLLNLVQPTAGTATIGGRRYADLADPLRHVGAVLEASSAHKGRTGRNHLRIICAAAGLPDSRADEVLTLVGLTPAAKRKFKGYSLGMRQRLGIAAAMLGDPGVLILDEPANGLDPEGIRWMRDLLQKLADDGRTILVSSHLLSEMELLADDVVIIAAGKLIAQGPLSKVVSEMGDVGQVRVRTPDPAKLRAALTMATITDGEDGALFVKGVDAPAIGEAALAAGVALHELTTERPDLERVFLDLTAGKEAIR